MNTPILSALRDRLRSSPWLIVAAVGLVWLAVYAPFKIGVLVYLLVKLAMAAYVLYWIDRLLFPYARPDKLLSEGQDDLFAFRMIARALIVAGGLIAVGMQA